MKPGESWRERIWRKNVQENLPKGLSILSFSVGIVAENNPCSRSSSFMDKILVLQVGTGLRINCAAKNKILEQNLILMRIGFCSRLCNTVEKHGVAGG